MLTFTDTIQVSVTESLCVSSPKLPLLPAMSTLCSPTPSPPLSKPMDDNQWWELLDVDSDQYYYHNAVTKETIWDRPETGDIIPLTELQV